MVLNGVKKILVAFLLILVWKAAWDFIELNPDAPVRTFGDIWDLRTYYNNGKWYPMDAQPYVDIYSEYPQVPTYLFGWVHWFAKDAERPGIGRDIYFHTFSLIMLGFAYLNFLFVWGMKATDKWTALLLFLPGPLYYSLFRFDALPAFLCLLALFLIRQKRWNLAAILLGIATLTKWYAILLIPPLVAHIWTTERKIPWRPVLLFLLTCFLIVLPTLLAGGVDALLAPYQYHSGRNIAADSLPGLLFNMAGGAISENSMIYVFLLLSVSASALSFFIGIDSAEQFEIWVAVVLGVFSLCSRIFSPQWILWILPSLILLSRNFLDILLIVVYGIFTYLGFPIFYDLYPSQLPLINLLGLLPLFILTLRNVTRLRWAFAYASLFSQRTKNVSV